MYDLVVTDDSALVIYLRKVGIVDTHHIPVKYPVIATDVIGKHVIGKLPHSLSCIAASYTEIPLRLPSGMRGVKLLVADYEKYADNPITYHVVRSTDNTDYPLNRQHGLSTSCIGYFAMTMSAIPCRLTLDY